MKRSLLLLTLTACGSSDALVADDFSYSTEEWQLETDTSDPQMSLDRFDDANGPHICGSDHGFSGATQFWRFQAPAKYSGNASRVFGKRLTWDARTNDERQLSSADLFMTGKGLSLVFNVPNTPKRTVEWRQFSVNLDTRTDWRIEQSGAVATDDEIKSVLSTLKSLRIPGEWRDVGETSCIDNVAFGVP